MPGPSVPRRIVLCRWSDRSKVDDWTAKLDPLSRLRWTRGETLAGSELIVRLTDASDEAASRTERAGLQVHARVGQILTGQVAGLEQLRGIASLPCVQEVQISRPLYEDAEHPDGRSTS
jgi:hypothetical protein